MTYITVTPTCMRWVRWGARFITERIEGSQFQLRPLSTSPVVITEERRNPEFLDFEKSVKENGESVFLIFGGDGSRKFCKDLAASGHRVLFVESTHDYFGKEEPAHRFGYETALEACVEFCKEATQAGAEVVVLPGKDKSGLTLWTYRRLRSEGVECLFGKTIQDIRVLRERYQGVPIICPEMLAVELVGRELPSVTSVDIRGKLESHQVFIKPDSYVRLTGGQLEKLPYELTGTQLQIAKNISRLGAQAINLVCCDKATSIPGSFLGEYARTFETGGFVIYLSDAAEGIVQGHVKSPW